MYSMNNPSIYREQPPDDSFPEPWGSFVEFTFHEKGRDGKELYKASFSIQIEHKRERNGRGMAVRSYSCQTVMGGERMRGRKTTEEK